MKIHSIILFVQTLYISCINQLTTLFKCARLGHPPDCPGVFFIRSTRNETSCVFDLAGLRPRGHEPTGDGGADRLA